MGLTQSKFSQARKRDGRLVAFDMSRIRDAVSRAMRASREGDPASDSPRVTDAAVKELNHRFPDAHIPSVEEIQDAVEESLILLDFAKTAKAYILYRQERARIREQAKRVPESIRLQVAQSSRYFQNPFSEFIFYRTYSRWIDEEGRRETWTETVGRYMSFMHEVVADRLRSDEYREIETAILEQRVMPSMRLLWSAGAAARSTHAAAYNCAYLAPTSPEDLAEIMYLLMCGTGVGFSTERQCTERFPLIRRRTGGTLRRHRIGDSKEGWCEALKLGLSSWYDGKDVEFDYSDLRPAGARLRTMGGRSSGPDPLRAIMGFARQRILANQGKRLKPIDVYDLICKIGQSVVMGGVRRSALISLSDLDDVEMRDAKSGHFFLSHPERSITNNSVAYEQRPESAQFLEEWLALAKSGSGERGIFNRGSLLDQIPSRRGPRFEPDLALSGTNPCGEIILRSKQFCNLTEVVARADDTERSLAEKTRIATILGTYQSMLTHFPYLSEDWRRKCEEERLLGVSLTGQWDSPASRDPGVLRELKNCALSTNQRFSDRFGIHRSAAVTCVKPSGTVSQLVNASPGMHPRHSRFYLRRVRISATDPLFLMLKDQKFPYLPEIGQVEGQTTTYVLEFPVRSPDEATLRADLRISEQLEHWKKVKINYTEHNPSVTISVGREDWIKAADWLYENWDLIGGLSFLPRDETVYPLSPYEEIGQEEYEKRLARLPKIDFSRITLYEKEDRTAGAKVLACMGGTCEIDLEEGPSTLPPAA